MARHLAAVVLSALIACHRAAALDIPLLPVWLEESHAGSFYFFADTLPLNEPHTLVLIDAHSDASAIPNSDLIRESIRRVPSREERRQRFDQWRRSGSIQCFDWMEPLMPLPFSEVIWIPARRLEEDKRAELERSARELIDGNEEALPREAGPFAQRLRVMDFEHWQEEQRSWRADRRVAVSVDLDWFAATPDEHLEQEMRDVTRAVLGLRGLKALAWALSTPWLRSQQQADRLMALALDESWRLANASVRWEPFVSTGPDRSLMAKLMERQGKKLPAFDLAGASPFLRSVVLRHWSEGATRTDVPRLMKLLDDWRADPFLPEITVLDRPRQPDGSFAVEWGKPVKLVLQQPPVGSHVRWWALRPAQSSYRVMEADLGFASGAPAWIQLEKVLISEGGAMGSVDLAQLEPVLDPKFHAGTVRVVAEVRYGNQSRVSNEIVVKVCAPGARGMRAAWSRQFALPYVFGSSGLREGSRTGPDAGWGADCANFITAGLRSEGWMIPWSNPKDLRPWLASWQGAVDVQQGCVLHFGAHVAALWEDRAPLGELGDDDLVVHQLEGQPEVLAMGQMRKGRPAMQVMGVRQPERVIRLVFGGDVMMGRRVGESILAGRDPLSGLTSVLGRADLAVVNLECPLLREGVQREAKAPFAAPASAAMLLQKAGVDGVTLANNHMLDGGAEGLEATLGALAANRVACVGAGRDPRESLAPLVLQAGERRVALISVLDDMAESAPQVRSHVATTADPEAVLRSIMQAGELADLVIMLPHWGVEHSRGPTARQRQLAAEWLDAGAGFVIGTGPHVVQALEHFRQGSVAWSLGNLVFDGPGPTREWSRGALLELSLDASNLRLHRARLLPVDIANDGTAKFAEPVEP